jgi:hypothetical protein
MKLTPPLHIRSMRAGEAEERLFIELWTLRRSLIDMKPEVGDEADYAAFRSFFAGDEARISLICGRDSEICGFLGWHARPVEVPGARMVIIDSDYYFVQPSLRGHVVLVGLALDCYVRGAARHLRPRAAIVGHGYPSSVLSGARFSDRVRFPRDEDVEPWEREAMRQFAERYCGESYDRERCLVRMRTIPAEPRRLPRSPGARDLLARFERHDPRWAEGWGLPYIIHLSPGSIARGALRFGLG